MKQIKTIFKRMDPKTVDVLEVQDFDRQVNEAIAEGWKLVKRDVFHPLDTQEYYHPRVLYAELEKDTITEAEKCCDNCKFCDCAPSSYPCARCEDASEWKGE